MMEFLRTCFFPYCFFPVNLIIKHVYQKLNQLSYYILGRKNAACKVMGTGFVPTYHTENNCNNL